MDEVQQPVSRKERRQQKRADQEVEGQRALIRSQRAKKLWYCKTEHCKHSHPNEPLKGSQLLRDTPGQVKCPVCIRAALVPADQVDLASRPTSVRLSRLESVDAMTSNATPEDGFCTD